MPSCLLIFYDCFCAPTTKFNSYNRDGMACGDGNTYQLTLHKNRWPQSHVQTYHAWRGESQAFSDPLGRWPMVVEGCSWRR